MIYDRELVINITFSDEIIGIRIEIRLILL